MEYVDAAYGWLRGYLSNYNIRQNYGNLHRISWRRSGGNPDRYHQCRFLEQYQRKSNLSNLRETDIKEVAEIFVDKRYAAKTVEEVEENEQLTIFLILRDDLSILPQKDTVLKLNDIIVIRGENEN